MYVSVTFSKMKIHLHANPFKGFKRISVKRGHQKYDCTTFHHIKKKRSFRGALTILKRFSLNILEPDPYIFSSPHGLGVVAPDMAPIYGLNRTSGILMLN